MNILIDSYRFAAAGGGGGGGFSPSDLSNLHAWYDVDAITGLSDTDSVSQWDDESGNGRHLTQGTASERPTYRTGQLNGRAGIEFDGGDSLTLPFGDAFSALSTVTVFVVARHDGPASTDYVFSGTTSGGDVTHGVSKAGASENWQAFAGSALDSGVAVGTVAKRVTTVFDGATSSIDVNGTGASGDTGARTAVRWFVGVDGGAIGLNWPGDVFEVVVYSRELNSTEIGQVETYLADKWGLA